MFPLIVSSIMAGDPNPVNSFDVFNFWATEEMVVENVEWAERHVVWVREMMQWPDAPVWLVHHEAMASRGLEAWSLLKAAREQAGTEWGVSILHWLRQSIGREAYYTGNLPSVVPKGYFRDE